MKIVFLAQHYLFDAGVNINGTLVQQYNLAMALADAGHEVHYVCQTKNASSFFNNAQGFVIHSLSEYSGVFAPFCQIPAYSKVLDQIRPDAIYARGRSTLVFAGGRWAHQNDIPFIWGSNGEDACDFWKRLKRLHASNRPLWKKLFWLH